MRVFVTKEFGRFARTQNIADAKLCEAVQRAEDGLTDADLGDGVSSNAWRARAKVGAAASER